jgi:mono/diheme cytochrome c family protein
MTKKFIPVITILSVLLMVRCGNNSSDNSDQSGKNDTANKGIGKFRDVKLTHPLDEGMISKGDAIYNSKCIACHKLTDEKLVGPGFKGVSDKRTPEWIMNFITNTNVMLDSDLVAEQLMVVCISRMPNQNLSDDEARSMLEFIRKNDGKN